MQKKAGEPMLPQDPAMLVSVLNLRMRDFDLTLDDICEEEDVSEEELLQTLAGAGYRYDAENRCFR